MGGVSDADPGTKLPSGIGVGDASHKKMSAILSPLFVLLAAAVTSASVLARLFQKHISGTPLLPYRPRRSVPWNFVAPLVILAPALTAVAMSAGAGDGGDDPGDALSVNEIWGAGLFSLALAVAAWAMLAAVFRATPRDLGFPKSGYEFFSDVRAGVVAFAGVLLPLYLVQVTLISMVEAPKGHPLMERMLVDQSPSMWIAAAFAALVAAPLFEETAFRLVLQGWLERRERLAIARGRGRRTGLIPGVALTWSPILISAVLFGAAHWGQNVAPASLTILGLALGYLYSRTHRIVPSIVCHMLFNGLSLALFLLQLPKAPAP